MPPGDASQHGSTAADAALDSLSVPFADDEDYDETPATTPTTAAATPTSAVQPAGTPGPTAEQLYHMMMARQSRRHGWSGATRRSRRPRAGGRMSQLESRFAAADRLRRSRSPRRGPSPARRLPSSPPAPSSSPSSTSVHGRPGLTPPQSARPRCGTGERDAASFKWSVSSDGEQRKLSSASQLPNVIIDDQVTDAQVRHTAPTSGPPSWTASLFRTSETFLSLMKTLSNDDC